MDSKRVGGFIWELGSGALICFHSETLHSLIGDREHLITVYLPMTLRTQLYTSSSRPPNQSMKPDSSHQKIKYSLNIWNYSTVSWWKLSIHATFATTEGEGSKERKRTGYKEILGMDYSSIFIQ